MRMRDIKSGLGSNATCFTRLGAGRWNRSPGRKGTCPFVRSDEWYNVFTLFPVRIKRTSLVNNAAEQSWEWLWRERARKASIRPMELALMHGSVQRTINRLLSNRRFDAHTRQPGANHRSDVTIARTIVAYNKARVIKPVSRMSGEREKQAVVLSRMETSGGQ